jgi:hypothetical protein
VRMDWKLMLDNAHTSSALDSEVNYATAQVS